MSVKNTTAYWRIKSLKKKIRVIQGGQGASKTVSIVQLINEAILTLPDNILANGVTVVTETYKQLADGVINDFRLQFLEMGEDFESNFNKSAKDLNFYGVTIRFRNIDNKDFHKSKGARHSILFVNEANRTHYASIEQMIDRTSYAVYIDYNPDREFWVHTEIMPRDDVDFLILTYLDNEMLSEGELKNILAKRSKKDWWRVYGEGKMGTYSERRILDYDFIDEIPPTAKRIQSGLDFGVHPDYTILIDLYLESPYLYCDERFCMNHLMPEKIEGAKRMSIVDQLNLINYPKWNPIVADSSGGSEIRDLRKHGYYVIGAYKPRGSVIDGLNKLRGYHLKLTKRSVNLKEGIESYFWKLDKNNKIIPEPDGHEPDGVAATRYGVSIIR